MIVRVNFGHLMSSINLSSTEAREAFDQLVVGLSRQHTRTKFRNYFGRSAGVLDAKTFARGTIIAERDKPVSNLLQEQPDSVRVTFFSGADDSFVATSRTEPSSITLQALLEGANGELAMIVRGRRADLFAYVDGTTDSIFLHRGVTEAEEKPKVAVAPKKQSRKYRKKVIRPSAAR